MIKRKMKITRREMEMTMKINEREIKMKMNKEMKMTKKIKMKMTDKETNMKKMTKKKMTEKEKKIEMPDTLYPSRGRLGRGSNAKTARNLKMLKIDAQADQYGMSATKNIQSPFAISL